MFFLYLYWQPRLSHIRWTATPILSNYIYQIKLAMALPIHYHIWRTS